MSMLLSARSAVAEVGQRVHDRRDQFAVLARQVRHRSSCGVGLSFRNCSSWKSSCARGPFGFSLRFFPRDTSRSPRTGRRVLSPSATPAPRPAAPARIPAERHAPHVRPRGISTGTRRGRSAAPWLGTLAVASTAGFATGITCASPWPPSPGAVVLSVSRRLCADRREAELIGLEEVRHRRLAALALALVQLRRRPRGPTFRSSS